MGLRVACLCRVGLVLMLPWHSHQIFGMALVALILFGYFYLEAQGKVAALNATFAITGVTLVPAFGAGSMDGGVEFAKGLAQSALGMFPTIRDAGDRQQTDCLRIGRIWIRIWTLINSLAVSSLSLARKIRPLLQWHRRSGSGARAGTATCPSPGDRRP